jgi:hypothetical protein
VKAYGWKEVRLPEFWMWTVNDNIYLESRLRKP